VGKERGEAGVEEAVEEWGDGARGVGKGRG
jgi:hypothetical protein